MKKVAALTLSVALLALAGCGGEIADRFGLWTLTDFGSGTPTAITNTGVVVYRNASNTVVAFPTGGTRTYPTGSTLGVPGNNGDLAVPVPGGFTLYNNANPNGLAVQVPVDSFSYGPPLAIDSQGRVYGALDPGINGPVALWVYAAGTFTRHDSGLDGGINQAWIDGNDRLLLSTGTFPGNQRYVRFSNADTFLDLGFFALTNLQVHTVDAYGNLCGSNNLGGDLDGQGVLWNGTDTGFYSGLTGSSNVVVYGQTGNKVVGIAQNGSTITPMLWQDGSAETLTDRVNFGENTYVSLVGVTANRVYITYETPTGGIRTGYLTPP